MKLIYFYSSCRHMNTTSVEDEVSEVKKLPVFCLACHGSLNLGAEDV